jgi:hypothetical protein
MIALDSAKTTPGGLTAPLFLILTAVDARLQALLIVLEIDLPTDADAIGKTGYGAILLMIAFVLSTLIIGFGGRLLGIPDMRIRVGLTLTFFILVFVTLVVYENLKRRWG